MSIELQESYIPFDSREQAVITDAHFFEPYKEEIHELFKVLGREDQWSDDPREMMDYIRSKWIGAEHGDSADKDQFTEEQIVTAMPIFQKIGLDAEKLPPTGAHFKDAIVVGGTLQANYRREKVVHKAQEEQGVTTDTVTFWLGLRPRDAKRDGTEAEMLDTEGRFAGNDISHSDWTRRQLAKGWDGKEWQNAFATETELGRAAMHKLVPGGSDMRPNRINIELTDLQNPQHELPKKLLDPPKKGLDGQEGDPTPVPARLITDYYFTAPDGQQFVVMNAAAVSRGENRPNRHTTASCAVEWLERHAPPENAKVLFVSSNPHTLRTAQDVYKILQEQGRGDIQLVVAGASAPPNATIQLFLGEVGRLIDNDVKRNYQNK